jgi:hypothetical protein
VTVAAFGGVAGGDQLICGVDESATGRVGEGNPVGVGLARGDAARWDLTRAHGQAAVIDSRIEDGSQVTAGGPLPWLPGIPHRLANDPDWGPYLNARSQLVAELADQVRRNAPAEAPAWAAVGRALVPAELIADLQVWRAATQVDPNDLRPTGPPQLGRAARIFQQQLDKRLAAPDTNANRHGVRYSPQKPPAPPQTHSCPNSSKS